MKSNHRKRGFTLVEILATLAGTTFLVASRSRNSALAAKTINNLREIGACSGMWMADNNNFYPPTWDNTNGANRSFAQVLDPYMHGVDVYRKADSKFIGPDADTSAGDGWFRYPNGKCPVLMCDGSAKSFAKGTILNRNIWIAQTTN